MKELTGKTAFITGAGGSGIGLGIAKTLAKAGMNIVISDITPDLIASTETEHKENRSWGIFRFNSALYVAQHSRRIPLFIRR